MRESRSNIFVTRPGGTILTLVATSKGQEISILLKTNNKRMQIGLHSIPYARHYNLRFVYFLPTFEVQKRFFKGLFSQNSGLMYGQYSRAVSNQGQVIMTRVRQLVDVFQRQGPTFQTVFNSSAHLINIDLLNIVSTSPIIYLFLVPDMETTALPIYQ